MLNINDIVNLIMTVTFVASFIGIFFFLYVTQVEREVVVKQINYITQDLTSILRTNLPPAYKKRFQDALNAVEMPPMDEADNFIKQRNDELLKKAVKVLGWLLVGGLILSYILATKYDLDFEDLLVKNLIMLAFIGLVEFTVATYVAKQYISADPNYVKTTILTTLKEASEPAP